MGTGEGSRERETTNPYDEMPVVSEYTRKLKEGIDIYKRRSSKPKRESRDLGALGNDQSAYDRL